jgi:hypothetical protein
MEFRNEEMTMAAFRACYLPEKEGSEGIKGSKPAIKNQTFQKR